MYFFIECERCGAKHACKRDNSIYKGTHHLKCNCCPECTEATGDCLEEIQCDKDGNAYEPKVKSFVMKNKWILKYTIFFILCVVVSFIVVLRYPDGDRKEAWLAGIVCMAMTCLIMYIIKKIRND